MSTWQAAAQADTGGGGGWGGGMLTPLAAGLPARRPSLHLHRRPLARRTFTTPPLPRSSYTIAAPRARHRAIRGLRSPGRRPLPQAKSSNTVPRQLAATSCGRITCCPCCCGCCCRHQRLRLDLCGHWHQLHLRDRWRWRRCTRGSHGRHRSGRNLQVLHRRPLRLLRSVPCLRRLLGRGWIAARGLQARLVVVRLRRPYCRCPLLGGDRPPSGA
jgi:hypothetical protein